MENECHSEKQAGWFLDDLPADLLLEVVDRLSGDDAIQLLLVSAAMRERFCSKAQEDFWCSAVKSRFGISAKPQTHEATSWGVTYLRMLSEVCTQCGSSQLGSYGAFAPLMMNELMLFPLCDDCFTSYDGPVLVTARGAKDLEVPNANLGSRIEGKHYMASWWGMTETLECFVRL